MTMKTKKKWSVTSANNQCTEACVPNSVLINWMNTILCQVEWNFMACLLENKHERMKQWVREKRGRNELIEYERVSNENMNKKLMNKAEIMHLSKNHLVPNDKISSYYFICDCLMPYRSVAVAVRVSVPSENYESMKFSFYRIILRCQDMNLLQTQNWIQIQKRNIEATNKANAKKWIRRRCRRRQRTFRKIIYTSPADRCIIWLGQHTMRWDEMERQRKYACKTNMKLPIKGLTRGTTKAATTAPKQATQTKWRRWWRKCHKMWQQFNAKLNSSK